MKPTGKRRLRPGRPKKAKQARPLRPRLFLFSALCPSRYQGLPNTVALSGLSVTTPPAGGAPRVPEAGQKQKPGKPSKKDILSIKDAKERKAAIAANIDLF